MQGTEHTKNKQNKHLHLNSTRSIHVYQKYSLSRTLTFPSSLFKHKPPQSPLCSPRPLTPRPHWLESVKSPWLASSFWREAFRSRGEDMETLHNQTLSTAPHIVLPSLPAQGLSPLHLPSSSSSTATHPHTSPAASTQASLPSALLPSVPRGAVSRW